MGTKRQITEYLDIDLERELWCCHTCGRELVSAMESYKRGCLVYDRDPQTIHPPRLEGEWTMAPNPDYVRFVEFYCPGCGQMIEVEQLPPGHPITHDIELDVDKLKEKYLTQGRE
ncbi:MAG: acetophenone carboxylase [Chloroflexota bacterium]|nr:MAG: acetophenone carboxylase [Chloroflexota bacterium]